MHIDRFTFGSIRIDGVTYEHDVVIARGRVRKRKKKPSKPFRGAFGHTPVGTVALAEPRAWCRSSARGGYQITRASSANASARREAGGTSDPRS
jgi:hypothetical protein